jgi:hypothetical protein
MRWQIDMRTDYSTPLSFFEDPKTTPGSFDSVIPLVTCLYLYRGYTVGSRGPYGLILDSIEAVAPEIGRMLRDGIEPSEILEKIDPNHD